MTGRDLIIFILENKLEDTDIPVPDILMTAEQAAIKFNVGISTIKAWYEIGMLNGIKIGDSIFFLNYKTDPRKDR